MKKLLYLFLLLPYLVQSQITIGGQRATYRNPNPQPIKIQVSEAPKTSADHFSDLQKTLNNISASASANSNANRSASDAAMINATAEEMRNNYSKISTDKLINNDGTFKAIVIENVSGWASKKNLETITEILNTSKKYKFYRKYKDIQENMRGSDKILYFSFTREAVSYSKITNIIVRNSQNKIIYDVIHRNKSHIEMLKPFTSSYTFDKEMVIKKLKELKELEELELISKEEYDSYVQKYKSIILKGF